MMTSCAHHPVGGDDLRAHFPSDTFDGFAAGARTMSQRGSLFTVKATLSFLIAISSSESAERTAPRRYVV
jgi:hypothetical protein